MTDTVTSTAATGTSLLMNLENTDGDPIFAVGQELTFSPKKGGRTIGDTTLTVTATTSVDELLGFFDATMGIQSGGGVPNDSELGVQPGVSIVGGM